MYNPLRLIFDMFLQGTAHSSEEIGLQGVMIWFVISSRVTLKVCWFESHDHSCVGDVKRHSVGKIRVVVCVVDCVECAWRVNLGAWGFLYRRQEDLSQSDPVGWKPAIGSVAKVTCNTAPHVQRRRQTHSPLKWFQSRVCNKRHTWDQEHADFKDVRTMETLCREFRTVDQGQPIRFARPQNVAMCHYMKTYCLYVCICIRVSLHTYIVINICIHTPEYIYIYVLPYIHTYTNQDTNTDMCMNIYI